MYQFYSQIIKFSVQLKPSYFSFISVSTILFLFLLRFENSYFFLSCLFERSRHTFKHKTKWSSATVQLKLKTCLRISSIEFVYFSLKENINHIIWERNKCGRCIVNYSVFHGLERTDFHRQFYLQLNIRLYSTSTTRFIILLLLLFCFFHLFPHTIFINNTECVWRMMLIHFTQYEMQCSVYMWI